MIVGPPCSHENTTADTSMTSAITPAAPLIIKRVQNASYSPNKNIRSAASDVLPFENNELPPVRAARTSLIVAAPIEATAAVIHESAAGQPVAVFGSHVTSKSAVFAIALEDADDAEGAANHRQSGTKLRVGVWALWGIGILAMPTLHAHM